MEANDELPRGAGTRSSQGLSQGLFGPARFGSFWERGERRGESSAPRTEELRKDSQELQLPALRRDHSLAPSITSSGTLQHPSTSHPQQDRGKNLTSGLRDTLGGHCISLFPALEPAQGHHPHFQPQLYHILCEHSHLVSWRGQKMPPLFHCLPQSQKNIRTSPFAFTFHACTQPTCSYNVQGIHQGHGKDFPCPPASCASTSQRPLP